MTRLPNWCSQDYLERFVGGCLSIINEADNYRYHGQIAVVELRNGKLRMTFDWLAVGVDRNNRPSVGYEGGWIHATALERTVPLFVPANPFTIGEYDMPLYVAIPSTSGDLLELHGGGVMDEELAFMLAGMSALQQSQVRPRDPDKPVDEESHKPQGDIPRVEVWEIDAHGRQHLRETIQLPESNPQ